MGVREKEKQETGLFNCVSQTATPHPRFPFSPGISCSEHWAHFLSLPQPSKLPLKNLLHLSQEPSRISLAGHEIISLDSNQNLCLKGPYQLQLSTATSRVHKVGGGGWNKGCRLVKSGQLFPSKNLTLIDRLCLSGYYRGYFDKEILFLSLPQLSHPQYGGWLREGLGVLTAYNYGWDRLCQ